MDVREFAIPTRKSLMPRDLIGGISLLALGLLLFITIVFVYNIRQYWFLAITAVMYMVLRLLTKSDEYLVEIVLTSLLQPDYLHA